MIAELEITEAECLEALASAAHGTTPKAARTVKQLCAELGWGDRKVRDCLRRFAELGRLKTWPVALQRIDGSTRNQGFAYTITPAPKARGR